MCKWIGLSLIQILSCGLFGATPMMTPHLDPSGQISKFESFIMIFIEKKNAFHISSAKCLPFCSGLSRFNPTAWPLGCLGRCFWVGSVCMLLDAAPAPPPSQPHVDILLSLPFLGKHVFAPIIAHLSKSAIFLLLPSVPPISISLSDVSYRNWLINVSSLTY